MIATPKINRGYLIALTSSIILSTTGILIRYLTQVYHIPSLVLAFWREVFVVFTLFLVLKLIRPNLLRVDQSHILYLFYFGIVLSIFNAIWTVSVALNGAAIATVLVYSSAGFTVVLGRLILKEHQDWVNVVAVILSLGGCILVSKALNIVDWQVNPAGIVTGITSGLGYALYTLMGRSASQRGINSWTTLLYTFGFATVNLLFFNLLPWKSLPGKAANIGEFLWLGNALAGWGILFLLAAGPTLLGFGMYNRSLEYLPSSTANLILTSEPVFTALIAFYALGERLDAIQIGGSFLILTGVLALRLKER